MSDVRPMLAQRAPAPFDDDGWWFEPKLDGIRVLVVIHDGYVAVRTRTGREVSATYPELAGIAGAVDATDALLDGEVVAYDATGAHSFEALQSRMHLRRPGDATAVRTPVAFVAFDVLAVDGVDVTTRPLEERRAVLDRIIRDGPAIQRVLQVRGRGTDFAAAARDLGLEGVMAKRAGSPYRPGRRSDDWRKVRFTERERFAVAGWTPARNSGPMGALLLVEPTDGGCSWVGQVGSGLSGPLAERLLALLRPLVRPTPVVPEMAHVRGATFTDPAVEVDVEFLERTRSSGRLRAPVLKGVVD